MCAMNTISVFLATKRTTAGAGTDRTARTVRIVHTRYSVETATEVANADACGTSAIVMNGKPVLTGIRASVIVHATTNATRNAAAVHGDSRAPRSTT